MNIIEQAKQIKEGIEKLQKKGTKITDDSRESAELIILIRDKNKIKGDLSVRGVKFEDL